MIGGGYYWIVVHIEYPVWRVVAPPYKNISLDHRSGDSVIAKRLHLQPAIMKETVAFRPLIDFIRVYVKSTLCEDVA